MTITSSDVQKYVRILLQWLAAYLVSKGVIDPSASWVTPGIGVVVAVATLGWTVYGSRAQAKIDDFMKVLNVNPDAMKALDKVVQAAILNAAGNVPGTQKIVNPAMSNDPNTSDKVTRS